MACRFALVIVQNWFHLNQGGWKLLPVTMGRTVIPLHRLISLPVAGWGSHDWVTASAIHFQRIMLHQMQMNFVFQKRKKFVNLFLLVFSELRAEHESFFFFWTPMQPATESESVLPGLRTATSRNLWSWWKSHIVMVDWKKEATCCWQNVASLSLQWDVSWCCQKVTCFCFLQGSLTFLIFLVAETTFFWVQRIFPLSTNVYVFWT